MEIIQYHFQKAGRFSLILLSETISQIFSYAYGTIKDHTSHILDFLLNSICSQDFISIVECSNCHHLDISCKNGAIFLSLNTLWQMDFVSTIWQFCYGYNWHFNWKFHFISDFTAFRFYIKKKVITKTSQECETNLGIFRL